VGVLFRSGQVSGLELRPITKILNPYLFGFSQRRVGVQGKGHVKRWRVE